MIRVRHRLTPLLLAGLAAGAACIAPLWAEDTTHKWQIGFGLSYMATTDYIRSNSDIAIASSVAGQENGLPSVTAVDERPDENMLNEPTVADDFRFDFNASYGLTRWLALEVSTGYMKSDVGNIEFFFKDSTINYGGTFGSSTPAICGPNLNAPCTRYNVNTPSTPATNSFVPVGTLTEIPLQLSALVRFRPESPLDPYVGLGIGYLFTDLQTGAEFNERGRGIANLTVSTELAGEYTDTSGPPTRTSNTGFTVGAMTAEVTSDFSWHAVAGVDYFINDHFSVYVDARYTWTDSAVNITVDGAHQVLLATLAPGKLQTFTRDTPDSWEDTGISGCGQCAGDHLFATEDSNGNGTLDLGVGEDGGKLYLYPMGPNPNSPSGAWTAADAVQVIDCTNDTICPWRGNANDFRGPGTDTNPDQDYEEPGEGFDREDRNQNRIMDRFVYYGVDVCSLPGATPQNTPGCTENDIVPTTQFVWPGNGCTPAIPEPKTGSYVPEGCPAGPPNAVGDVSGADSDNPSDVYIIQGGEIKLGGFSLGIGFKITF
ncbi:MAG TPA: outer membrane beta-barrel protein [Candidatus Polarisedimenticolia bacterium]|nr:outer membrane beta-barrel protein [Candidatus Polarisedimenticolia bacterium]